MDIQGFLEYMETQFEYNSWAWEMMENIINYVFDMTVTGEDSAEAFISTLARIIPEIEEEEIRPFIDL